MTTPMGVRVDGFRSLFEQAIARDLAAKGAEYGYESCSVPYTVYRVYTPDFTLANGIHVEAKGYFTGEDRNKLLMVKNQNPGIDIRLVFMTPNKRLSKTSKTTYAMWAERNGFKWASQRIPQEWIDE